MPLFVCEHCKTVDNTALGHYWGKDDTEWEKSKSYLNGMALCYSCMPTKFIDGSGGGHKDYGPVWHGKWPKQHVNEFIKENPDTELINWADGKIRTKAGGSLS